MPFYPRSLSLPQILLEGLLRAGVEVGTGLRDLDGFSLSNKHKRDPLGSCSIYRPLPGAPPMFMRGNSTMVGPFIA